MDFEDFQPTFIENETDINELAKNQLNRESLTVERLDDIPSDSEWIALTFAMSPDKVTGLLPLEDVDITNQYISSATLKYSDSSIGGNIAINTPYQFTRNADIRVPGLRAGFGINSIYNIDPLGNSPGKKTFTVGLDSFEDYQANSKYATSMLEKTQGMGRYYSEAIDDNNQIIHLRFGVAQFNSLFSFFTGFYNNDVAAAARSGTFSEEFLNSILRTAGKIVGIAIAPLFFIPMAINAIGTAVKFFLQLPMSKFYNLKPSMPLYWGAVQTLVNQIGVNMGLTYPNNTPIISKITDNEIPSSADNELSMFNELLPEIFMENGLINVYAIANKYKLQQMNFEKNLAEALEQSDPSLPYTQVVRQLLESNSLLTKTDSAKNPDRLSFESYIYRLAKLGPAPKNGITADPRAITDKEKEYSPPKTDIGFLDYFISNFSDGSEFLSLRVEQTGTVSESFSNSVTESSIATNINSISKNANEKRFNFADGNVDPLGIVSGIKDALTSFVGGVTEVIGIEGIGAVLGNGQIEIPKYWNGSSANLTRSNYSITLTTPYNNPISQMMDIYIPLACIMAGALPLATGKQSFTSPFLCQVHDRGRLFIRLGIIDSLTISRGINNLAFTNEGKALGIQVDFSITDLSNIMAVPIQPGFSLMPLQGLFDHENALSDYLLAIAGTNLTDSVYQVPMLKRQLKKIKADKSVAFSSAQFANYASTLPGVGLLNALARGVDK